MICLYQQYWTWQKNHNGSGILSSPPQKKRIDCGIMVHSRWHFQTNFKNSPCSQVLHLLKVLGPSFQKKKFKSFSNICEVQWSCNNQVIKHTQVISMVDQADKGTKHVKDWSTDTEGYFLNSKEWESQSCLEWLFGSMEKIAISIYLKSKNHLHYTSKISNCKEWILTLQRVSFQSV